LLTAFRRHGSAPVRRVAEVLHAGCGCITSDSRKEIIVIELDRQDLAPLTEAEALRAALSEVGRRFGRLVASLRHFQKQRRALQSAWTSLKQLRLGPPEES
jgi:hypothetical protein